MWVSEGHRSSEQRKEAGPSVSMEQAAGYQSWRDPEVLLAGASLTSPGEGSLEPPGAGSGEEWGAASSWKWWLFWA